MQSALNSISTPGFCVGSDLPGAELVSYLKAQHLLMSLFIELKS
jgi:hypothetical protein